MAFLSSIFWLFMFSVVEAIPERNSEGHRCPTPGNTQSQAGHSLEQPDVVEDVPANFREVGLNDL